MVSQILTNSSADVDLFALRPFAAAKVSEISEATALSRVPPQERVNFHIGNPVQDARLILAYKTLLLGRANGEALDLSDLQTLAGDLDIEPRLTPFLELVLRSVDRSVTYLPRGGFSRHDPGPLAPLVRKWLLERQEEPLSYDLGVDSGRRELTFASGGRWEALRVLFATLNEHLVARPAVVLLWGLDLPRHLLTFENLRLVRLDASASVANALRESLESASTSPHFVLLGAVPPERERRRLRFLALERPVRIIETSNAPNHLSLAREAGLAELVLRILTPDFFLPQLGALSLAVVLGNSELLTAFEKMHFQLKGTPSGPEIELLAFALQHPDLFTRQPWEPAVWKAPTETVAASVTDATVPAAEKLALALSGYLAQVEAFATRASSFVDAVSQRVEERAQRVSQSGEAVFSRASRPFVGGRGHFDPLGHATFAELLEQLANRISDPEWERDLEAAFLAAFVAQHPEYEHEACFALSGSARTALSLLGFHAGVSDVVVPDLSWTYENCFPNVTAVPLSPELELDVAKIRRAVREKLATDANWKEHGAVVLNNPHNATGKAFREDAVEELLLWALENGVRVVDDLSYENVGPWDHLSGPRTARQIASNLVRTGRLPREALKNLVTVHSLSKTDCFAGARLAVVEILDRDLRQRFAAVAKTIRPNHLAILLAYLFYRNPPDRVRSYWLLRNRVLAERMTALEEAVRELPVERNPYGLRVVRPRASMYPRLEVQRLPSGVSLDWIATSLANRGIGLIPFSTFARTAQGFDLAHRSFRLTLGGGDSTTALQRKMRRTLIDLNRVLGDEESRYNLRVPRSTGVAVASVRSGHVEERWNEVEKHLAKRVDVHFRDLRRRFGKDFGHHQRAEFLESYVPKRLGHFRRMLDAELKVEELLRGTSEAQPRVILELLESELQTPTLSDRREAFRRRLFDRTVHPTQVYSVQVDVQARRLVHRVAEGQAFDARQLNTLAREMVREFLGENVPVTSKAEARELVCDLRTLVQTEDYLRFQFGEEEPLLLSFWGDWDGSTRPSGQGHRLSAAALLEDVRQLAALLRTATTLGVDLAVPTEVAEAVQRLEEHNQAFWRLLDDITDLTSQLEQRYLRVLPFDVRTGAFRRLGMRLRLARDPLAALWQHNDRLERRMLKLRRDRRASLEFYLKLDQALREVLARNLDRLEPLLKHPAGARVLARYRDVLRRFALTPRIHQRIIVAHDQFAIDTTVHNLVEINRLAVRYGVPGMIFGIQISMSTDPEALVALDRKIRAERLAAQRRHGGPQAPAVWVIPLFEDLDSVHNLDKYLDRVWDYAVQSRRAGQPAADRFSEIICEIFVAGSDLSQQVSQPAGAALYREAKYRAVRWLSQHGLSNKVRIKLGSGEPAQRQGGYYDRESGLPAVLTTRSARKRLAEHLNDAEQKAAERARTPLQGILAGGEFRTFQSNLAERLRHLSVDERARILFHVRESQRFHETELRRAAAALQKTRLRFLERGLQELELLTLGRKDEVYDRFLESVREHFRQILYGRPEDVVGLHVISYFVSRAIPALRDRPVVRPSREVGQGREREIVGRLAQTLPLAKHGSLLRAIGHNRAQTVILGVNQLTTGLFRALQQFVESASSPAEATQILEERVFPNLPVRDILNTLRLYHDPHLTWVRRLEAAFPAGNSAFVALREDNDALETFIPALQRELLRQNGLLLEGFLENGRVKQAVLPALRPDLAVLLQRNLFNTDPAGLLAEARSPVDASWRRKVEAMLRMRQRVFAWRAEIWKIIEEPIRGQVESFVGLALAISKLSEGKSVADVPLVAAPADVYRLGSQIAGLLRRTTDDAMRQFLIAAVQYLTHLPKTATEVPLDVIRALRDVERIVKIEGQALTEEQLARVRFYVLQIARLCKENG